MFDEAAEALRIYSLSLPRVKEELLPLLMDYEAWTDDWKMTLLDSANLVYRHASLDPGVGFDVDFPSALMTITMQFRSGSIETVTRYLNHLRRYLGGGDAPTAGGDFSYGNPLGYSDDEIEPDDDL